MADHSGRKVTLDQQGNLLLIGLNRPEKRNAADTEMLSQLALAYGELEKNPDLRVGVVFAHGDHFTAGLDLVDVGPALQSGNKLRGEHRFEQTDFCHQQNI